VLPLLEGNLGLHDASDVLDHLPVPSQQLLSPTGLQRYHAVSDIDRTAHANNLFTLNKESYCHRFQGKNNNTKEKEQ
jgi:hypothetical protein